MRELDPILIVQGHEHRWSGLSGRLGSTLVINPGSIGDSRTLLRITCGLPKLRTLRDIMEEVYRLFDRRCCLETALDKLRKLRQRVRRFHSLSQTLKKLFWVRSC